MDIRKIRKLIELMDETGVTEIELKEGEEAVRINRQSAAGPQPVFNATNPPATAFTAAAPAEAQPLQEKHTLNPASHVVKSPVVGTAYLAPKPGAPRSFKLGNT